jgi:hypothetical protein
MTCSVCRREFTGLPEGCVAAEIRDEGGQLVVYVGTPGETPNAKLMACSQACQAGLIPLIGKAVDLAAGRAPQ